MEELEGRALAKLRTAHCINLQHVTVTVATVASHLFWLWFTGNVHLLLKMRIQVYHILWRL